MKRRLTCLRNCLPVLLFVAASGFPAMDAAAQDPIPSYVAGLEPKAPVEDAKARERLAVLEKRLASVVDSLESVEARLGRTIQPPTSTRNFERRMDEIERRLTVIERNLTVIDTLQREQKQLDNRIQRLETKR